MKRRVVRQGHQCPSERRRYPPRQLPCRLVDLSALALRSLVKIRFRRVELVSCLSNVMLLQRGRFIEVGTRANRAATFSKIRNSYKGNP